MLITEQELEREINKGSQFRWKKNMKILLGQLENEEC